MDADTGLEQMTQRLRALGAEMLARAEAGDWDGAAGCDLRRRELVGRMAADVARDGAQAARLAGALREALDEQRRVRALLEARRESLNRELGAVRLGRHARSVYASVGGG